MNLLSRTEELVLLAVWRLQKRAYGAAVLDDLTSATGEDWSIGVVYQTLDRLARKGLLKSRIGEPTPERGGRSKRYFEVTTSGVKALGRVRGVQNALWESLREMGLAPGERI
jgi:DNA-binding PadR family transcriptional regulator